MLDSDDSFGLPKMSGGRKTKLAPNKSAPETPRDNDGGGFSKDGGEKEGQQKKESSYFSGITKHTQPTGELRDKTHSSGSAWATTAGGSKSPPGAPPKLDIDSDFDSPDEADALLRLTDPTVLAASAPATPPLKAANPRQNHNSRGRAATTSSAVSERGATGRSPSPPSGHPRALPESPDRSPRRLLPGRGYQSNLADNNKKGDLERAGGVGGLDNKGGVLERAGEVGGFVLGRTEHASGAHPASSVNLERVEDSGAIEPTIRQRPRVRGVGLSQTPSRESVGVEGGGMTDESLSAHGPGLETSPNNRGHNHDDSRKHGESGDIGRPSTTFSPGAASGVVPRRSALVGADKPRSLEPKPRAVTFDDDLGGLDALDILPSSDENDLPDSKVADEPPKSILKSSTTTDKDVLLAEKPIIHSVVISPTAAGGGSNEGGRHHRSTEAHGTTSPGMAKYGSTSITKGLSPAAARLVAEDSSSEESAVGASVAGTGPSVAGVGASIAGEGLGLEAGPKSLTAVNRGVAASLGLGLKAVDGDGDITDDAKLDLALGFTPSAMEGGRRPRRTLPAGRRRRPSSGIPAATGKEGAISATDIDPVPTPSAVVPLTVPTTTNTPPLPESPRGFAETEIGAAAAEGNHAEGREVSHPKVTPPPAFPRVVGNPNPATRVVGDPVPRVVGNSVPGVARISERSLGVHTAGAVPPIPAASVEPLATASGALTGPTSDNAPPAGRSEGTLKAGGLGLAGGRRGEGVAPSPTQVGLGNMDASVFASLERQLALLTRDRESAAMRLAHDEQRHQRESDSIRDALAAAEARAFEAETALAAAR